MGKTKELKYYDVQKVNTIKQLLEMAVEQAGDKIAFKYKEGKDKVKDVSDEVIKLLNGTEKISLF